MFLKRTKQIYYCVRNVRKCITVHISTSVLVWYPLFCIFVQNKQSAQIYKIMPVVVHFSSLQYSVFMLICKLSFSYIFMNGYSFYSALNHDRHLCIKDYGPRIFGINRRETWVLLVGRPGLLKMDLCTINKLKSLNYRTWRVVKVVLMEKGCFRMVTESEKWSVCFVKAVIRCVRNRPGANYFDDTYKLSVFLSRYYFCSLSNGLLSHKCDNSNDCFGVTVVLVVTTLMLIVYLNISFEAQVTLS